jgi:THO complex subunit 5
MSVPSLAFRIIGGRRIYIYAHPTPFMLLPESNIPEVEPVISSLAALVAPNCPIALDSDEGQAYANALFAKLKALNRQAHATVRQYKQKTAESRASMEESLLKLQNLLYEKRHLEREIEKCKEYACVWKFVLL